MMELLLKNYLGNSLLGWILLILFLPLGVYLTIVKDLIIGVIILVILLILELIIAFHEKKLNEKEQ